MRHNARWASFVAEESIKHRWEKHEIEWRIDHTGRLAASLGNNAHAPQSVHSQCHCTYSSSKPGMEGCAWKWQGDSEMYMAVLKIKNSNIARASLKNSAGRPKLPETQPEDKATITEAAWLNPELAPSLLPTMLTAPGQAGHPCPPTSHPTPSFYSVLPPFPLYQPPKTLQCTRCFAVCLFQTEHELPEHRECMSCSLCICGA